MDVLILNHREVRDLLPIDECIAALEEAFVILAQGDAIQPLRWPMFLPDRSGLLGMMPGFLGGGVDIDMDALGRQLDREIDGLVPAQARAQHHFEGALVALDELTTELLQTLLLAVVGEDLLPHLLVRAHRPAPHILPHLLHPERRKAPRQQHFDPLLVRSQKR